MFRQILNNIKLTIRKYIDPFILREKYLSPDIIPQHLLQILPYKILNSVRNTPYDDLSMYNESLGVLIRTRYRLWDINNPYIAREVNDPNHPDNVSLRITQDLWKLLQ